MSPPPDTSSRADATGEGTLLTTGEMARCSSNTLRTVRFYEEEGILRPVRRTDGGHRLFDRRELERLMLVTDLREAGLSLEEIKQILEVKQRGATPGDASKVATTILAKRIGELREKLAVLTRLQDDLGQTTDILRACLDCRDPRFPAGCESCTIITSQQVLPRSMRVLWTTTGTRPAGEPGNRGDGT